MTDYDILTSRQATLSLTDLHAFTSEHVLVDFGAIIICRDGTATARVNFKEWQLRDGAVIMLFPNDTVLLSHVSDDFHVGMLRYDQAMLREASLQLEHTVHSLLRKDSCLCGNHVVTEIIDGMFNLLRVYFRQEECVCLDQLVLYQLKAFFLGFYDWISRHPLIIAEDKNTRRTNELFGQFMELLERNYQQSRDVTYYADLLHITPKYLNTIVRRMIAQTPKEAIDQYVILRLKLLLRTSDKTIKQISWEYNFSDVSFFCRYFKTHAGTTPQSFRKSLKSRR